MKREIKFRAWHNGEMWDMEKEDRNLLDPIDWEEVSYLCHILGKTDYPHYFSYKLWELMQFTGLKDKNGKEIYEGDIITYYFETDFGPLEHRSEVEYLGGAFYPVCEMSETEFEVIGNIYENPNLL